MIRSVSGEVVLFNGSRSTELLTNEVCYVRIVGDDDFPSAYGWPEMSSACRYCSAYTVGVNGRSSSACIRDSSPHYGTLLHSSREFCSCFHCYPSVTWTYVAKHSDNSQHVQNFRKISAINRICVGVGRPELHHLPEPRITICRPRSCTSPRKVFHRPKCPRASERRIENKGRLRPGERVTCAVARYSSSPWP